MPKGDVNIGLAIAGRALAEPGRPALRGLSGTITYGGLLHLSLACAEQLRAHGANRASCVAIDKNLDFLALASIIGVSLIGCRFIGATPATRPFHRALGITHTLVTERALAEEPKLVAFARERDRLVVMRRDWFAPAGADAAARLAEFDGHGAAADTWMIAQSSGTTGTPKFVPYPYAFGYEREGRLEEREAIEGRAFLYLFPPMSAFVTAMLSKLAHGGTLVSREHRLAGDIDTVTGSPHLVATLIEAREAAGVATRIRLVVVGGGAMPPGLYRRIRRHFDFVRVGYGSTEAGRTCSRQQSTSDPWPRAVGRPYPGCEVEIVSGGRVLGPGEEGEVRLRTPYQATGYFGGETGTAFRDGWFHPGDIGRIDDNGELVILGRAEDMLNIGGVKINGATVDAMAQSVAGVRDAVCFATVEASGKPMLGLLVVPADGKEAAALPARVANSLWNAGLRIRPSVRVVGEIPRNANGKAMREDAARLA